ncbi:vitelline membrane outer layer protein 1 homolog [Folsomia candida]|uniref:Vitelline membrane outer layer protein 1 n=1 Tax=Folsomia candida TaxID=158441 RepID=A0A226E5N8_FOLCA|nr:vitelline membrane outer layer protein 1 homolog [Folsomia candida]OXA51856.1 Vitelline membrane outer layer protein 1 [Folsomia candida]
MAILPSLLLIVTMIGFCAGAPDFILEGHQRTNWGTWGDMATCAPGSYVYGFRLKVHSDQGFFGDDSALNGIELLCISPTAKRPARNASMTEFSTITSLVGHHGSMTGLQECPDPGFAVGYELRSEGDQGFAVDDTAANNLKIHCSGLGILEGAGQGWGDWTGALTCPRGLKICGIQTQVEGPNSDDTTLNNVNMGCCV